MSAPKPASIPAITWSGIDVDLKQIVDGLLRLHLYQVGTKSTDGGEPEMVIEALPGFTWLLATWPGYVEPLRVRLKTLGLLKLRVNAEVAQSY